MSQWLKHVKHASLGQIIPDKLPAGMTGHWGAGNMQEESPKDSKKYWLLTQELDELPIQPPIPYPIPLRLACQQVRTPIQP